MFRYSALIFFGTMVLVGFIALIGSVDFIALLCIVNTALIAEVLIRSLMNTATTGALLNFLVKKEPKDGPDSNS